jgi:hypothetical protein
LNIKIYTCVNTKLPLYSLLNDRFLEDLNQIVWQYNLLVSEILHFRKVLLETSFNESDRIIQKNMPPLITKLQCLFVESSFISLLSILEIKQNKGSYYGGYGKYKFKNFQYEKKILQLKCLKRTTCYKSKKLLPLEMIPKNCKLSEDVIEELKLKVQLYNDSLIDSLLKKTLVKTMQKNYKAQSAKRVLVSNKNSCGGKSLEIFTLRERILQKIIWTSIYPIAEFQADIFSFAYRPRRFALMCVTILYNRCIQMQKLSYKF